MEGEVGMVLGEGWISDDSSFYGSENEQEQLTALSENYQTDPYWRSHNPDLNDIIARTRQMDPQPMEWEPSQPSPQAGGRTDSWQRGETAEDFVRRLPPLTTPCTLYDWIWVYNPSSQARERPDTARFLSGGRTLLQQSLETRNSIRSKAGLQSTATTSQLLSQESQLLKQRIHDLASETKVRSGKWMLFPELTDLPRVWRLVVDGVIENRLGTAAKVATDDGSARARLICVYTKDFQDTDDILRVLNELVSMGLAGVGKSMYYKSDPFTLLDIYSKTAGKFGLQASLFSSQQLLAETRNGKADLFPRR